MLDKYEIYILFKRVWCYKKIACYIVISSVIFKVVCERFDQGDFLGRSFYKSKVICIIEDSDGTT